MLLITKKFRNESDKIMTKLQMLLLMRKFSFFQLAHNSTCSYDHEKFKKGEKISSDDII